MKTWQSSIPGWWSSQIIGRTDPYDEWMPNLMVSYHCVPRTVETKRRFRELCRKSPDRYGVYYDLISEDDRKVWSKWNTVFKLYAPVTRISSHEALTDELLVVLETKSTRGSAPWIARWKKKFGRYKKAIQRARL